MNVRKMPSGKWQSVVYVGKVDGKKKFVTVTESSKSACLLKAAQVKMDLNGSPNITVGQAVEKYMDAKEGVISPSTIAGYEGLKKRYIDGSIISKCLIGKLTPEKMQKWVSEISKGLSKKTVSNAVSFVSAAVRMFAPKADLTVRLPQGKRYEGYVPSTEEVILVLKAARDYDERLYRACLLAAFGAMRRGEISPLTSSDVYDGYIRIEKDMVKDSSGKWVTKLPKTETSVRDVPFHSWVLDQMPKEGRLVDYYPDEITKYFGKVVRRLGIPLFRFHDLRKHAVSLMAAQGVSMPSIKDVGGWSNVQTPQRIYVKALADAHKREMTQYVSFVGDLSTKL